jgi:hypothetical protein
VASTTPLPAAVAIGHHGFGDRHEHVRTGLPVRRRDAGVERRLTHQHERVPGPLSRVAHGALRVRGTEGVDGRLHDLAVEAGALPVEAQLAVGGDREPERASGVLAVDAPLGGVGVELHQQRAGGAGEGADVLVGGDREQAPFGLVAELDLVERGQRLGDDGRVWAGEVPARHGPLRCGLVGEPPAGPAVALHLGQGQVEIVGEGVVHRTQRGTFPAGAGAADGSGLERSEEAGPLGRQPRHGGLDGGGAPTEPVVVVRVEVGSDDGVDGGPERRDRLLQPSHVRRTGQVTDPARTSRHVLHRSVRHLTTSLSCRV